MVMILLSDIRGLRLRCCLAWTSGRGQICCFDTHFQMFQPIGGEDSDFLFIFVAESKSDGFMDWRKKKNINKNTNK